MLADFRYAWGAFFRGHPAQALAIAFYVGVSLAGDYGLQPLLRDRMSPEDAEGVAFLVTLPLVLVAALPATMVALTLARGRPVGFPRAAALGKATLLSLRLLLGMLLWIVAAAIVTMPFKGVIPEDASHALACVVGVALACRFLAAPAFAIYAALEGVPSYREAIACGRAAAHGVRVRVALVTAAAFAPYAAMTAALADNRPLAQLVALETLGFLAVIWMTHWSCRVWVRRHPDP